MIIGPMYQPAKMKMGFLGGYLLLLSPGDTLGPRLGARPITILSDSNSAGEPTAVQYKLL